MDICEGLRRELVRSGNIATDATGVRRDCTKEEACGVRGGYEEDVYSSLPPGARPFLRRTLDIADRLAKRPLTVVDTLADTLVKGVGRIGEHGPVRER
jgi:hypothetical protein